MESKVLKLRGTFIVSRLLIPTSAFNSISFDQGRRAVHHAYGHEADVSHHA